MRVFPLCALLLLAACGGSKSSTGPNDDDDDNGNLGTMSATVNGTAWTAATGAVATGAVHPTPGLYTISGITTTGAAPYTIVLTLWNVGATGTYPIGMGPTTIGATAQISNLTGGWATVNSGNDGTLTITTLSSTRITGTFSFTANALTGTATGTRTITNGTFDLPLSAGASTVPLPANAGSTLTATVGGTAFRAAAVAGTLGSGGSSILSIAGQNNTDNLSITLADVPGPGTYALGANPTRTIGVTRTQGNAVSVWSSAQGGSSGTVTVTSVTATRITGTFTGTIGLALGAGAATLAITNGSFSIGRP